MKETHWWRRGFWVGMWALVLAGAMGWAATEKPEPERIDKECVVLMHGLGRTASSMKRLEWYLTKRGYQVINLTYPSLRCGIDELTTNRLPALLANQVPVEIGRVHFVTHSYGGIVLRRYVESNALPNLGRVVMLAPPNGGSELVDRLERFRLVRAVLGPGGCDLGTAPGAIPDQLGPVGFSLGVIAGDRTLNPLFSWLLPGADDGKVSVAATKVDGMRDFTVIHTTHTTIMWKRAVFRQTLHYLRYGSFEHKSEIRNSKSETRVKVEIQ